ncbi:hypothetical protein D1O30_02655 [Methylocystis hirsuta]|uniref:Uncharacterized protein n=1 Tax=Methylocystis hirsuta TaxID=369798 RepID=A0A3M9XLK4_9HYPH|nr:hypothetical protein D1O30_02655 [Methylocystis hirsuta]
METSTQNGDRSGSLWRLVLEFQHRSGVHFVVVACAFEFADFTQTALKRQLIEALSPVRREVM